MAVADVGTGIRTVIHWIGGLPLDSDSGHSGVVWMHGALLPRFLLFGLIFGCLALGQQSTFEVASIRSHGPEVRRVGLNISGPRITVEAFALANLITYAYDLKPYQVIGGPDWAQTERFDIAAKAEGDATSRDEGNAGLWARHRKRRSEADAKSAGGQTAHDDEKRRRRDH